MGAPHILGSNNVQHQEVLAKAEEWYVDGMSDVEIVQKVNEQLQQKAKMTMGPPIPEITLREVQHYFKNVAAQETLASMDAGLETTNNLTVMTSAMTSTVTSAARRASTFLRGDSLDNANGLLSPTSADA